ncbi:MAG: radical SAM protein [Bdellovibrionota bacterium]|nr:radical SAM protein [Pseudomonadota bacterium]MDY6089631.1 radical SAM protein [Bdellovibrionota bacterium]
MYRTLKAPLSVQLEVTGSCNISCKHCYNFWRGNQFDECYLNESYLKNMTVDTVVKLFREIVKFKIKNIVITGGEPLLNYNIVKFILKLAKENHVSVSMNSNLILINDDIAVELKELGLKGILTSFMGSCEKVYEAVSGVNGTFQKATDGLRCVLNNGFNVTCNMVTTKLNVQDVFNTASFVKQLGVTKFAMTPASIPANCSDFSQYSLIKEEVIFAYNELLRVQDELNMVIDTLVPLPLCFINNLNKFPNFIRRKCSAGITFAMISSGGIIRPCPNTSIEFGSVLEYGLEATWKRMTSYRSGERIPKDCKECKLLVNCLGGCRYRGEKESGKIYGLDSLCDVSLKEDTYQLFTQNKKDIVSKTEIPKDSYLNFINVDIREEEFGAVVLSENGHWLIVNSDGCDLVKKCIELKLISTNEQVVTRNKKFFLMLLNSNVVSITSNNSISSNNKE